MTADAISGKGPERSRLLIVDDDGPARERMRREFCGEYEVFEARGREEAVEGVSSAGPWVAIIDLGPPSSRAGGLSEGLLTLEEALGVDPCLRAITTAGEGWREGEVKALELGAFDCFTKPFAIDEVRFAVRRGFHLYGISRGEGRKKERPEMIDADSLGWSPPMREAIGMMKKVAPVDVPVLILGETGTGKELAAKAIHNLSPRRKGPFAVINCGAIPEDLLESELFGYEKGAFTGAESRKKGRIESADRGTLFLDEVGELSPKLQAKLLRFLQENTIERLGAGQSVVIDARVISATNRDLLNMVGAGGFREDLYFRLGVITIEMPPLRQRGEDISTLALRFLKKYSMEINPGIEAFDRHSVNALLAYGWPGNVRELDNRIKRAVALCSGAEITASDLGLPSPEAGRSIGFIEAKESFKKKTVQETLLKNRGAVGKSAAELGISRQYLSRLIAKYRINVR